MIDAAAVPETRTNRLPLAALLVANAVSQLGNMLSIIALPWFVLQTTGSAAQTGLTGFFVLLPNFVAGIFGGTLVDRFGFKRVSVVADLVSGIGIAAIPLLYLTVGLPFWGLLGLVFVGALLAIPGLTARRSLLPDLARLGGVRLERTNAAFEGFQSVSWLLGPPLAGILIAWLGTSNVLWLDAGSFAVSAVLVAVAVPTLARNAAATVHERYRDALVAGLRFLRGDRVLLALAVSLLLTNFYGSPLFAVVLPVFARDAFGSATDLGLMATALGAGELVGAVLFGAIGHRLPRRATWIVAFAVSGPLSYWALSFEPSLPVMVGVLAFGGLLGGPLNPLLVTVRHERIPAALRGRVFSTFSAISQVASPLGILTAGALIEAAGFRPTVLALAIGAQIIGLGMLFVPAFHDMDATKGTTAD
jgi:MFS family permease